MKSFPNPPQDCKTVWKAILILKGVKNNSDWNTAKNMMNNPKKFIE